MENSSESTSGEHTGQMPIQIMMEDSNERVSGEHTGQMTIHPGIEAVGELQRLGGTEQAYLEMARHCQLRSDTSRWQISTRIDSALRAVRSVPVDKTAINREAWARDIVAARRAERRGERRRLESLGLNEGETPTGDPAIQNQRDQDQTLFDQDVRRLRHLLQCLRISTVQEPYLMIGESYWAPPGSTGVLPSNKEARRMARAHPHFFISVRFTTRRPSPSHTAHGFRRPPALVFCLPSAVRDPDTYLESLARPSLDQIDEDDHRCHICQDPYTADGPTVAATPGNPWLQEGQPEVPIQLRCKHIFGSHCLRQWFASSDNNACPLCRDRIDELNGEDRENQLRTDVMEALFKLGRTMAEQGQISGMEFAYGSPGPFHPEILRLRVPQSL